MNLKKELRAYVGTDQLALPQIQAHINQQYNGIDKILSYCSKGYVLYASIKSGATQKMKAVAMRDRDLIHSPPHYLSGRTIQPIDVIEGLILNHHLACVVKYISRAGRKNPILEDVLKCEWYLARFLTKGYDSLQDICEDSDASYEPPTLGFSAQEICDDWQLSNCLCGVLINIFIFAEGKSRNSKENCLTAALDCLRAEIDIQEKHYKMLTNQKNRALKIRLSNNTPSSCYDESIAP